MRSTKLGQINKVLIIKHENSFPFLADLIDNDKIREINQWEDICQTTLTNWRDQFDSDSDWFNNIDMIFMDAKLVDETVIFHKNIFSLLNFGGKIIIINTTDDDDVDVGVSIEIHKKSEIFEKYLMGKFGDIHIKRIISLCYYFYEKIGIFFNYFANFSSLKKKILILSIYFLWFYYVHKKKIMIAEALVKINKLLLAPRLNNSRVYGFTFD